MAIIEWMLLAPFDDPKQFAICALHSRNEAFCYAPLPIEFPPQLALTNANLKSFQAQQNIYYLLLMLRCAICKLTEAVSRSADHLPRSHSIKSRFHCGYVTRMSDLRGKKIRLKIGFRKVGLSQKSIPPWYCIFDPVISTGMRRSADIGSGKKSPTFDQPHKTQDMEVYVMKQS